MSSIWPRRPAGRLVHHLDVPLLVRQWTWAWRALGWTPLALALRERAAMPPWFAAAPGLSVSPITRVPAAPRVIAVGDVHGDLTALRRCLRLAGVIDDEDRWSGGDAVVVQVGDVLDRGDQERATLHYLDDLHGSAQQVGGAVYRLLGNHEVMNVDGDFRYVTAGGFAEFQRRDRELAGTAIRDAYRAVLSPREREHIRRMPRPMRDRATALAPGAPTACKLADRGVLVLVVGDTLFVHGGLRPEHVAYGLERLNAETAAWMRRLRIDEPSKGAPSVPATDAARESGNGPAMPTVATDDPAGSSPIKRRRARSRSDAPEKPWFLRGSGSPIWMRHYSAPYLPPDSEACQLLNDTLRQAGLQRMVVGHTPQRGINSACGGRVWRVDTGMSAAYGGVSEALELYPDGRVYVWSDSGRLEADEQMIK